MGKNISLTINKLKIVDCADDDEDMMIRATVFATDQSGEKQIGAFYYYDNVYVEEETKIGNDTKCTFYSNVKIDNLYNIESIRISIFLKTLDGDGYNWYDDHDHSKNTGALQQGNNYFIEGYGQSHKPICQGTYELHYTIEVL